MADGMNALPAVYAAIAAVMEDVGHEGIAKDRKNQQQGYNFRGIDDVYNALAPILARHKLIIVPRVMSREKTERETAKGGVLFYVVVHVEFDIVCPIDGSKITASTYGEAMDSADKATNKAMSAAYKYMAMQTFCIPTEGDNDADASHYEVRPNAARSASPPSSQQATGAAKPPEAAPVQTMGKGDARADFAAMAEEMRRITSSHELKDWGKLNAKRVQLQPKDWQGEVRKQYLELMQGLEHNERAAAEAEQEFADAR
jgi:hypothetical protein